MSQVAKPASVIRYVMWWNRVLQQPIGAAGQAEARAGIRDMLEWLDASDGVTAADCPNCGDGSEKTGILRAPWPRGMSRRSAATLLRCACCGCGFFDMVAPADYAATPVDFDGYLAFYLQQGAGVSGITSNLSQLNHPRGSRLLEVGCGFGFGLDFARRALGWDVLGLDPSPFAAAGCAILGLPILSRYVTADDATLRGSFDVVMVSEVIEHVPSPLDFARLLRSCLTDGGVLVLTTPAVEAVDPGTPPGLLTPLLSIGHHLVLQSEASLAAMLSEAGFQDIEVSRVGNTSLLAYASERPLPPAFKAGSCRDLYRRYLLDAAAASTPDSDLWLGLTVRAYREAVNVADTPTSDGLWAALAAACNRRYRFNPETGASAANRGLSDSITSLAAREPLCLGPLLHHRALHRLHAGESRTGVEDLFGRAAQASGRLRDALATIGADDGDAEAVAWVARAEQLLCAAERGAVDAAERFAEIGRAPGDFASVGRADVELTESYRQRIFVSLVNSGRYDAVDSLLPVVANVEARCVAPAVLLSDAELDVLYCAVTRELQRSGGSAERALQWIDLLCKACDAARAAGRHGSAATLPDAIRQAEAIAREVVAQSAREVVAQSAREVFAQNAQSSGRAPAGAWRAP